MTPAEALATIRVWLPPTGMTSVLEEPVKPEQAKSLQEAVRTLSEWLAEMRTLLVEVDEETSTVHDAVWTIEPRVEILHSNDRADSAQTAIWRIHGKIRRALVDLEPT